MGTPDKRRQKRLVKGNRKTTKEMKKAVETVVQQVDIEERRRAAQTIIDRVMRSLVQ
jgi:hypothetical protein